MAETTAPPAPSPPPDTVQAPPLPPEHVEQSKQIFKKARVDIGLDKPAEQPKPEPSKDEPQPPSKVPADVITPPDTPPEVKSEAVAEIEAMALPKDAKPERIENFKTLKEKALKSITKQEQQIKDLQRQMSEATSKTQLDELTKAKIAAEEKAQQIEEQFSRIAFEHTPKFKAMFTDRERAALDGAKKYLEGTEVRPDVVELAARETGKRRIELLREAGVEPDMLALIGSHLANYDSIQTDKKAAVDNWQSNAKAWQAEQQQQAERAKAQRSADENSVWDSVLAQTDLLPLRKSKDNADWNNRAEALRARAKALYNGDGAQLPDYALTLLKGTAYDVQQEVIDHLKGRVQSLETENASLKSAAPGASMTTTAGQPPAQTTPLPRMEEAKRTFNEQKAAVGAA